LVSAASSVITPYTHPRGLRSVFALRRVTTSCRRVVRTFMAAEITARISVACLSRPRTSKRSNRAERSLPPRDTEQADERLTFALRGRGEVVAAGLSPVRLLVV